MITAPSTFCVPGGPPSRRCPGPKRRISMGASATTALSSSRAAGADRGLRGLVLRLAEEARAAELIVVRLDVGRETEEGDPHESGAADDDRDQDEQEIEVENDAGQDEAERHQAR